MVFLFLACPANGGTMGSAGLHYRESFAAKDEGPRERRLTYCK